MLRVQFLIASLQQILVQLVFQLVSKKEKTIINILFLGYDFGKTPINVKIIK